MVREVKLEQKPLNEQVIVLTGATSGIGLCTARAAAKRGARLMLIARNEHALEKLAEELNEQGGDAMFFTADVADSLNLSLAADQAVSAFGRIDTWINDAGVSIYGRLAEVTEEDSRRLFDTNFWGVVNGSLIAARHMRFAGGTIINVGSTLSDRAIPIQGMYSASKHAVKGFTEAFRMELEAESAPISVTLIKPAAIDTPYIDHARNYLGVEADNPPPVYSPDVVADTILYAAENPVRDVFVGAGGKMLSALGNYMPRTADVVMENTMIGLQRKEGKYVDMSKEGLHYSVDDSLRERGHYDGHVAESSVYTTASLHPLAAGAAFAVGVSGAIAVGKLLLNLRREREPSPV